MKILITILITALFAQSYFFYELAKNNSALNEKYEDAKLAIRYHENKNLETIKQLQLSQSKIEEMEKRVAQQKVKYTELKVDNDQTQQSINNLKEKNHSQKIIIQQKDNEMLILKNELLKYLSE